MEICSICIVLRELSDPKGMLRERERLILNMRRDGSTYREIAKVIVRSDTRARMLALNAVWAIAAWHQLKIGDVRAVVNVNYHQGFDGTIPRHIETRPPGQALHRESFKGA